MEQLSLFGQFDQNKNYFVEYQKKQNHDFDSALNVDMNVRADIVDLQNEISKIQKDINTKKNMLSRKFEQQYGMYYVQDEQRNILNYSSSNVYDYYYSLETGEIVENVNNDDYIIKLPKLNGEFGAIVGYNYELCSIIINIYKYSIPSSKNKVNLTLISEVLVPFLEIGNYYINSNLYENDNYPIDNIVYNTMLLKKSNKFIENIFGIKYDGQINLQHMREAYLINKCFEIILKTAPSKDVDKYLNLPAKMVDTPKPLHKILNVSKYLFDEANRLGLSENLFNYATAVTYYQINTGLTDNEILAFLQTIKNAYTQFKFYNISYGFRLEKNYRSIAESLESCYLMYYYPFYDAKYFTCYCNNVVVSFENCIFQGYYTFNKFVKYTSHAIVEQGFTSLSDFCIELSDYLNMSAQVGSKPTLYSSYLKVAHDVAVRNHSFTVNPEDEITFINRYANFQPYYNGDYKILAPKSSDDVKKEGDDLSHCVAAYIKSVIDGECLILFLRKDKDVSLITIAMNSNGVIYHVKGANNRNPLPEEKKIIQQFADKRGYICNI